VEVEGKQADSAARSCVLSKHQGVLNNQSKHLGDDAAPLDEYRVLLDMTRSSASEKTLRIWRKKAKGSFGGWVRAPPWPLRPAVMCCPICIS
jgi:hypothetical protein